MATANPFKGILKDGQKVGDPFYYLYEIEGQNTHSLGLVASIPLSSVNNDFLLPHEQTFAGHAQELFDDISACGIQYKPLILMHDNLAFNKRLWRVKEKTDFVYQSFDTDFACHRLWKISNPAITDRIMQATGQLHHLCIADGHHRSEAIRRYHQNPHRTHQGVPCILGAIFYMHELRTRSAGIILEKALFPDIPEFFELHSTFEIHPLTEARMPENIYELSLFAEKMWFLLKLKTPFIQQAQCQGLLSRQIFKKYFFNHFKKPHSGFHHDFQIRYERDLTRSLIQKIDPSNQIALITFKDDVGQIFECAHKGHLVDPNSTYFEPKLQHQIIGCSLNDSPHSSHLTEASRRSYDY